MDRRWLELEGGRLGLYKRSTEPFPTYVVRNRDERAQLERELDAWERERGVALEAVSKWARDECDDSELTPLAARLAAGDEAVDALQYPILAAAEEEALRLEFMVAAGEAIRKLKAPREG
ncbi:hypothetical protein LVJ94_34585 [Pendulispora rubella]|uniref:Uncharacterized protein n=1 Tax=Pendulispora rubella TaxID=2741070 RepID=A0ABZ2KU38_9BACT